MIWSPCSSYEKKQVIILAKGSTNMISHLPFVLLKILMLFPEACRNSMPKIGHFPALKNT